MEHHYQTPLNCILASLILVALFLLPCLPLEARGTTPPRAVGELGLQTFSERREDASGAATSERTFKVDLATGAETEIGEAGKVGFGVAFEVERGLHSNSEISGLGVGGFLSWRRAAFSVRLDGVVLAEQKSTSSVVETSYREGSGWGLEVRWLPTWIQSDDETTWALGPSLSMQKITFKKSRVGTLPETEGERSMESISPGLRAIFLF